MVHLQANFHRMVPRDFVGNLCWRLAIAKRCSADPEFAAAIRQVCAVDILFWVNTFGWTFDPRCKPRTKIPFVTYEFQERAILRLVAAVDNGKDLLIEKSRDMGASWICLLVFTWLWLFRSLLSFLLVSRTEKYVDDSGNPKSLFWKIDFLLKHLPPWMRPETDRTKLHLLNLGNGSVIDGESTTGDVARGDRRTAILLDEFAAVEQGHRVLKATRDATNCRIFNSTHQGTGTAYYAQSRKCSNKLRMHWSEHPVKAIGLYTRVEGKYRAIDREYWASVADPTSEMERLDGMITAAGVLAEDGKPRSPWYADQCERAAHSVEIAQELDIDCLGSSFQFFAPAVIEDHITRHCRLPYHVGELEYDAETLDFVRWREDPHGKIMLWMQLDKDGRPIHQHVNLAADVSAGTGASNSSLSGWNQVSLEKVLEYTNPHIRPEALGKLSVAVAKWLGNAFLIWEQNGPGRQFGDAVLETGYRHIYLRRDEEKVSKIMSDVPGWASTRENKLALLGDYRRALELQTAINRSEDSLRDCLEYIYLPNGSVEHAKSIDSFDPTGARSNHGDRAMADALAWKLCKDRPTLPARPETKTPTGSFAWRRQQYLAKKRQSTAW